MDPNANLAEQREIGARLLVALDNIADNGDEYQLISRAVLADMYRFSELVEALDEWIVGGGFLPDAWGMVS